MIMVCLSMMPLLYKHVRFEICVSVTYFNNYLIHVKFGTAYYKVKLKNIFVFIVKS